MADRAKYIRIAVANGITDLGNIRDTYNRYDEGGYIGSESSPIQLAELVVTPRVNYTNYTGEETYSPTLEEFIASKQDAARASAVMGMLQQDTPVVPKVPSTAAKVALKINSMLPQPLIDDNDAMFLFGTDSDPFTCIYTASSQYGKEHAVPGNRTLYSDPERYGFQYVSTPKKGDIAQAFSKDDVPFHAGMVTDFGLYGRPLISQSHGGTTPDQMEYDSDSWPEWVSEGGLGLKYLTFIGNKEDKRMWEDEYKLKYK